MQSTPFEYPYYDISEHAFPKERIIGNNSKRLLVLSFPDDFDKNGVLLKKILRAVDFDFEQDISFLTVEPNEQIGFMQSVELKNYDTVILFGVTLPQIGLSIQTKRTLFRLENLTLILSQTLGVISENAQAKRELWGHLQQVFKAKS